MSKSAAEGFSVEERSDARFWWTDDEERELLRAIGVRDAKWLSEY